MRPGIAPAIVLAAALPCAAQPAPTVTVTNFPGGTGSEALCISGNGNVVGGYAVRFGTTYPMRWTRETGVEGLGLLPAGTRAEIRALSHDGSIAVGFGNDTAVHRAIRWAGLNAMDLGSFGGSPSSTSQAWGVSADGLVIVGEAATRAFRWTQATGLVDLGFFSTAPEFSAWGRCTNADGSIVFGYGHARENNQIVFPWQAFRWEQGVMQPMGVPAGWRDSKAYAATPDGSVVVGTLLRESPAVENSAFRWTAQGGIHEIPFRLPGGDAFDVGGCTADGKTVVGSNAFIVPGQPTTYHGVVWSEAGGVRDLHQVLTAMGALPAGRVLNRVTDISDDGTVMTGVAGTTETMNFLVGVVIDFRNDTDGDGLLDHWEINGIPYVNDLGQDRRVHLPGADPAHKDLYVEIDAMLGFGIDPDAVDMVVEAFANAPLTNPDGTTGVRLHVLVDEGDLAHIPVWNTGTGCWPMNFNMYYDAHFGTPEDRLANGGGGVLYRNARAKAYRYAMVADRSGPLEWGGCAHIPGDQMVLYFGLMSDPLDHAAAFMHELGHNLGLHHGGNQPAQGKPNYPSIMNYVLAYKFPWCESFWRLDYSREGALLLGHLDENSLDEMRGIGYAGGPYQDFLMPYGVNVTGGRSIAFAPLDGSPVDFGDAAGTGFPDGNFTSGVAQDLNYLPAPPPQIHLPTSPSPGQTLTAHNDWATVVLATPAAIGPGAPAPVFPEDELTIPAKDWIAQNFPIPGGGSACYANCDGSTTAPVLNVADFTCFLQRFASGEGYANCDGSTTPPVLNVADFTCFLQSFAAGCP